MRSDSWCAPVEGDRSNGNGESHHCPRGGSEDAARFGGLVSRRIRNSTFRDSDNMATTKSRLEKIENSLTPKQAILAWVHEAHKFTTLDDYGAWLAKHPEQRPPLNRLTACIFRRFMNPRAQSLAVAA